MVRSNMSETEKGTVLGHCGLTEGEVGLVSTAFISGGSKFISMLIRKKSGFEVQKIELIAGE